MAGLVLRFGRRVMDGDGRLGMGKGCLRPI